MLTVQQIWGLERERYNAMRDRDVAPPLDPARGRTGVHPHSNAQSDDTSDCLRKIGDGTYVYHSIALSDERTTISGETALVSVRTTADVSVGGVRRAVDSRALAVWVNTPDGCKLFAYQPTVIPTS